MSALPKTEDEPEFEVKSIYDFYLFHAALAHSARKQIEAMQERAHRRHLLRSIDIPVAVKFISIEYA